jgi:hypothetical protein
VSPDPRTTVVIMTRDRRAELLRTLDLMTRLPEGVPIIVVDNASSDGTRTPSPRRTRGSG